MPKQTFFHISSFCFFSSFSSAPQFSFFVLFTCPLFSPFLVIAHFFFHPLFFFQFGSFSLTCCSFSLNLSSLSSSAFEFSLFSSSFSISNSQKIYFWTTLVRRRALFEDSKLKLLNSIPQSGLKHVLKVLGLKACGINCLARSPLILPPSNWRLMDIT